MLYNNKEIPKLGFGLMRLPMIEKQIDIEQTKKMVDIFMENGFTYFDTAYGYLEQRSEGAAKTCLVDRYPRESFQLATKLPAWSTDSPEKAREMFYTSLSRAGVDYFDFYLLHNLGDKRTQIFEDWKLWDFVAEQKALGKIKKLGFSLHDGADHLEQILSKHPEVDFVQLQINYADWESPVVQSRRIYEVATAHNVPVIIMEPVRGGALANPPEPVQKVLDQGETKLPSAIWALKFAASLPNVVTVLSGMSNMEQMTENLKYFKDFTPLSSQEQETLKQAQEALATIPSVPCTVCRYCEKDCPVEIKIPDILTVMNKKLVFADPGAQGSYNFQTRDQGDKKGAKAKDCLACGKCETVCPQSIKIIEELARASEWFDQ